MANLFNNAPKKTTYQSGNGEINNSEHQEKRIDLVPCLCYPSS